jgi:acyl-CoA thioesterase II
MSEALQQLIELLDLETIEVNIFRGHHNDEDRIRTFGGQVAAQALVAAGRTVEGKLVHSLHAYFLRPGDPHSPILYEVDRIRDGRSFATRRVVAIQHGEAIFHLSASFHVEEPGFEHQIAMPTTVDPDSLPDFKTRYEPIKEQLGRWYDTPRPIDQRHVETPRRLRRDNDLASKEPRQQVWFRPDGKLPDDPLLHACIVAYASDMTLLDSAIIPHNLDWDDGSMMGASLDHAMWFHRPFRADQWMLYSQESTSAYGARAVCRGEIFTQSGELIISVVQEGLIRPVHRPTQQK